MDQNQSFGFALFHDRTVFTTIAGIFLMSRCSLSDAKGIIRARFDQRVWISEGEFSYVLGSPPIISVRNVRCNPHYPHAEQLTREFFQGMKPRGMVALRNRLQDYDARDKKIRHREESVVLMI